LQSADTLNLVQLAAASQYVGYRVVGSVARLVVRRCHLLNAYFLQCNVSSVSSVIDKLLNRVLEFRLANHWIAAALVVHVHNVTYF